jgi:hypothetical protein
LENATPFELAWSSANSSAAISLYDFWPPYGSLRRNFLAQHHDFRALLGMAQAALSPRAGRTRAIASGLELGNKAGLLVLMESDGSLSSVRSSPLAVSTRTPRAISAGRASSCVTSVSLRRGFQLPTSSTSFDCEAEGDVVEAS